MDELSSKGLIISGSRADIATNSVALVIPTNSNSRIKSVDGLASGEIKRIAVGNFRTTPAGRYSEDVFNYYRLLPAISDKLGFTGREWRLGPGKRNGNPTYTYGRTISLYG
jgi:molybdate transport system substrate-binding protein